MFNEGYNEKRKIVVYEVENELAHYDGIIIITLVLEIFVIVVLDGKLLVDEASDGHENGIPKGVDTIVNMMFMGFPIR